MNSTFKFAQSLTQWSQQSIKTKIGVGIGACIAFSYFTFKFLTAKPPIHSEMLEIKEFVKDQIWIRQYLINYMGCIFYARCSVIRLSNGKYLVHSPSPMDDAFERFLHDKSIEYIVAPGNYHYFNVALWSQKYPKAKVLIAPGVEYKAHNLKSSAIYGMLHDNYVDQDVNSVFNNDFELSLIRGFSEINEVAMLHKETSTLILLDVMEYVTTEYYDYFNRLGHLCWFLFGMHNKALPAPEYQFSLKHKLLAKDAFDKIMSWEFNKIIINHGQNIYPQRSNHQLNNKQASVICKNVCKHCWAKYST
eukprot:272903_1